MTRYEPIAQEKVMPTIVRAALSDDVIAERLKKRVDLPEKKLCNPEYFGILRGNLLIGGIVFEHREIHMAVLPEFRGRWLTRSFYRFLADQYRQRGVLIGRVHCSAKRAEHFVRRFAIGERQEGNFTVFSIAPPFGRMQ